MQRRTIRGMPADLSRLTAAAAILPVERRSFPLRLWGGNPQTPVVYVATPKANGPGYTLRRYVPEVPEQMPASSAEVSLP